MKIKATLALSAAVLSIGSLVFAQNQNQSHGNLKQNVLPLQPSTAPTMPRAAQGWKVEVVAEPPQLKWPSVVEVAPDGRIFVAEDPMDMPGPGSVPADRILCIVPDGHITVFAEKLYAVYGMRDLDGKLYVHHTPKFMEITDNDGIGTDPKDIWDSDCLKPWGNGSLNDHIPSNLRVAMDNYMYLSTGDKGMYHAKSNIDGKMIDLRGGGIARVRPDGTDLEVYTTGTRNHLDLAINPEDEIFTYDNTDDGLGWWTRVTHMVDGGYYGYPYDYRPADSNPTALAEFRKHLDKPYKPYTLWRMDEFGGGSPTGAISYNEDALPPEYRGNGFFCEWGKGDYERMVFQRDPGTATYKLAERDQMIAGAAIRPLGTAIGADGMSFYVTDWQEGGWAKKTVRGRLFKITYTGGPSQATAKPQWYIPAAEGKPFSATLNELIAGLSHPAQSVRLVAQRRIAEKGQAATAPLIALLNNASVPAHARWHAIWTLDRIDGGVAGRSAILAVAKDPKADESVRLQAIRQLGTRKAAEAAEACVALLSSESAPIRFRAATALGRIGSASAVPALVTKLNEKDFFTHYAIFNALHRIGTADSAAWPAIVKGLASSDPAIRAGTQYAIRETFDKGLADSLAAFVADAGNPADARGAAIESLASLHREKPAWDGSWWGTQPERSAPPRKSVEWEGTPVVLGSLQKNLTDANPAIRRATIDAFGGFAPDPKAGPVLVEMFGKERDTGVRQSILHALASSKSPEAISVVTTILKDPKGNADLVPDAIAVAASVNNDQATAALVSLVDDDSSTKDLTSAFEALGKMRADSAVNAISKHLKDQDADVAAAAAASLGQIRSDAAVASLMTATKDTRPQVAKASIAGLGTAQDRSAIPALMEAYKNPATKSDAITALARMPDVRAIDAYLEGLTGEDAALRTLCRRAIEPISDEAWPMVEARLDVTPKLSRAAINELQRIYTKVEPITRWHVLGPFAAGAADPFTPQSITNANELPSGLHGAGDKELTWRNLPARRDGFIDLVARMDPKEKVYAYAVAELEEKSERDVEFEMGADDGLVLWVNGQKVFEDLKSHTFNAGEFHAAAQLKAGTNIVLAKITQDSGPWGFAISTTMQKKGKLFDTDTKSADPAAYAAYLNGHTGDAAKGSIIFHNATGVGCIKCHIVGAEGGNVGPNLSDVAIKYNRDQIVESVLYPSKQIESGYEQTIIRTKSGDTQSGVVRGESETEVTLYDSAANKIVVRKSDIDRRVLSKQSVMPDGLQASLTYEQFADLIAYLTSLKEAPKK